MNSDSNIFVNTRSSIKLTGSKTIYFDPLEIEGAPHDADLIFVTHEHYDHFSPDDIQKVLKADTQLIVPSTMLKKVMKHNFQLQNIYGMLPMESANYDGLMCQGIPAYNTNKLFHPKKNNWLGYLVELDGKTYYAMGDTDDTPEARNVDANVVFIPIGGKYTMDATEAAAFVNDAQPKLVVPIHYGDSKVADLFIDILKNDIQVHRFW